MKKLIELCRLLIEEHELPVRCANIRGIVEDISVEIRNGGWVKATDDLPRVRRIDGWTHASEPVLVTNGQLTAVAYLGNAIADDFVGDAEYQWFLVSRGPRQPLTFPVVNWMHLPEPPK